MSTSNGITLKAALEQWSAAELPLASPNLLPDLGMRLLFSVSRHLPMAIKWLALLSDPGTTGRILHPSG
ncbi:hypothetical protein [Prosthecobacter sp.]|uniref:hypothetical protein n=1 Tax=Prosthecobacter sp. TaxID=1965333 RepID=UPI0037837A1D